jgi:hypothetical protein
MVQKSCALKGRPVFPSSKPKRVKVADGWKREWRSGEEKGEEEKEKMEAKEGQATLNRT